MKTVDIYTDGSCRGNPGVGGWGAILVYGPHQRELSGGEAHTTNNRMELTAVIEALAALKEPFHLLGVRGPVGRKEEARLLFRFAFGEGL